MFWCCACAVADLCAWSMTHELQMLSSVSWVVRGKIKIHGSLLSWSSFHMSYYFSFIDFIFLNMEIIISYLVNYLISSDDSHPVTQSVIFWRTVILPVCLSVIICSPSCFSKLYDFLLWGFFSVTIHVFEEEEEEEEGGGMMMKVYSDWLRMSSFVFHGIKKVKWLWKASKLWQNIPQEGY